jgi:hypothetical protein
MLIARAAQNRRFLASANAVSASQHCPSMVIAPDGEVISSFRSERPTCSGSTLTSIRTPIGTWASAAENLTPDPFVETLAFRRNRYP